MEANVLVNPASARGGAVPAGLTTEIGRTKFTHYGLSHVSDNSRKIHKVGKAILLDQNFLKKMWSNCKRQED